MLSLTTEKNVAFYTKCDEDVINRAACGSNDLVPSTSGDVADQ